MPNLTFNAIDVETANRNRASICQVGLVQVRGGRISNTLNVLVDPEEPFEPINTSIHGIDEEAVRDAPSMNRLYRDVRAIIEQAPLVSHSSFDRQALERAAEKYGLELPPILWLDSGKIARATWPDRYGREGWALKKIAQDLKIEFRHHDALEDAMATAQILLHAHRESGLDVDDWLEQAGQGRSRGRRSGDARAASPEPAESPAAPPVIPKERQSTRTPSWDESMLQIMELEGRRGFDNRAVMGGFDRFIQRWMPVITEELGPHGLHQGLMGLRYAELDQEERAWWIQEWRDIISRRVRNGGTAPRDEPYF